MQSNLSFARRHAPLGVCLLVATAGYGERALAQGEIPSLHESSELWSSNASPNDSFGVALAAEGNILAIGANRTDEPGASSAGSTYIFEKIGGAWTQVQELVFSNIGVSDFAGSHLAITGNTLLIGSTLSDVGGPADAGAIFVFTRSGTAWTEQGFLSASDASQADYFSSSLALFGDSLVVGAAGDDDANPGNITTNSGSAYIFERQGSAWFEQAKLVPSDTAPSDQFGGGQVALGVDIAFVSATGDDVGNGPLQGSVYVFERIGTIWVETQKLVASDGDSQQLFGFDLSLYEDRLLVGAKCAPSGGAVYSFTRTGSSWIEGARLAPSSPVSAFGSAISFDGSFAVIGAAGTDFSGFQDSGTAFLFSCSDTGWEEIARLEQTDPEFGASFGSSVLLLGDTAFLGAVNDTESGTWAGSVYEFDLPIPATYCSAKTNSSGCAPFIAAQGTPSISSTVSFRVSANDVLPNEVGLLFYGFKKANLNFHGGKLCIKPPFVRLLPPKASKSTGPPPCSGVLFRNFNARIQSGSDPLLTAGQLVRSQWLQRDPGNGFFGDSLTDALQFTILP